MRARLLLDSELLLWALAAPARLSREARALLDESEVYASAASIVEIGLKSADGVPAAEVLAALEPSGFRTLAVTAEHAALAAEFGRGWPDPLDRLLVAQASAEGMTLLTSDAGLAALPAGAVPPAPRTLARKAGHAAERRRLVRSCQPARRARAGAPPVRCRIVLVSEPAARRHARP